MNENFSQDKILKYLIIVLIVAGVFILVNSLFFKSSSTYPFSSEKPLKEVKIDFDAFIDPAFQELLPFERISFPEEVGRENPFEPY